MSDAPRLRPLRLVFTLLLAAATISVAVWSLSGRPSLLGKGDAAAHPGAVIRHQPDVDVPLLPFVEITEAAGIRFIHDNGASGEKLLPETMGGGVAFFDYDGDGDPDILFVNSQPWPGDDRPIEVPARMALYRNEGRGRYEDVTADAGLDVAFYGMGVACGDFDGDGLVDLFLTAVGKNRLYRNAGGRFEDVTATAGVAGPDDAWSTGCGWFDYDGDGDLDLFVCRYVQWSREYDAAWSFALRKGMRTYGRPQNFEGTYPALYRNNADGTFDEVSESAGLWLNDPATGKPWAKSLGLTFLDVDEDGRIDVLVANDTVPNFLFRNRGDGTFEEIAAAAGLAYDAAGNVRGAMGIDAGRFRTDASLGVAVGNFAEEGTALYVTPRGSPQFTDEAVANGIYDASRRDLTFGVLLADLDLDTRCELVTANGHLELDINLIEPGQHYAQPPRLFWNCGREAKEEFVLVPWDKCGFELVRPMVARGLTCADVDGDGDLDLLLSASGGKPRLARNDQQSGHHWLRVRLTGTESNREAIGAWVEARLPDGRTLARQVMPTRSYLSQCELPVTFGLGEAARVTELRVRWPSGRITTHGEVAADRRIDLVEGAEGT